MNIDSNHKFRVSSSSSGRSRPRGDISCPKVEALNFRTTDTGRDIRCCSTTTTHSLSDTKLDISYLARPQSDCRPDTTRNVQLQHSRTARSRSTSHTPPDHAIALRFHKLHTPVSASSSLTKPIETVAFRHSYAFVNHCSLHSRKNDNSNQAPLERASKNSLQPPTRNHPCVRRRF